MKNTKLPLVYSCSGCSSVAQLANDCAIELDRSGKAQMSCISGVGGGVDSLVRLAQSGRPILALDGCALACVKACLVKASVKPTTHLILNREGARKKYHVDADEEEKNQVRKVVFLALDQMNNDLASTHNQIVDPDNLQDQSASSSSSL